jgi:uncharacterized protein YbjT (DUF2867 family)
MVQASSGKTILVTGATGKQGGAVLRHLIGSEFKLRALTRHPESDAAQRIAAAGVELARGDLNDASSLRAAIAGTYGVYSVQNSIGSLAAEVAQGKLVAELAAETGVRHLVYSSAAWADRNSGIPHADSKWEIEQHIRALGLPATVLRPVFFMQNWERQRPGIAGGALSLPLSPQTRLHQISVDDIGAFAARAFKNPSKYIGGAFDLAGDVVSIDDTARTFAKAIGRPVSYVRTDWADFESRMGREFTIMYRYFERAPFIDPAALRAAVPAASTLEAYLRTADWVH